MILLLLPSSSLKKTLFSKPCRNHSGWKSLKKSHFTTLRAKQTPLIWIFAPKLFMLFLVRKWDIFDDFLPTVKMFISHACQDEIFHFFPFHLINEDNCNSRDLPSFIHKLETITILSFFSPPPIPSYFAIIV